MRHSIDQEMLDALELFYYASNFGHRRFLCCFEPEVELPNLLLDLRLLIQAKIEVILVINPNQQSCFPTSYPVLPCARPEDIKPALASGMIPVITLDTNQRDQWPFELARQFQIKRILWIGAHAGVLEDNEVVSHLDLDEFQHRLKHPSGFDLNHYWGPQLAEKIEFEGLEWVFVQGQPGALFQEVFTHQGSGTLIAKSYDKQIARAGLNDLVDLLFLMRPYVKQGTILEVTETQLAQEINQYWVYRLNGSVVVAARSRFFGDDVEIGKFCSLPRYQGKGRAQELIKEIAQEMKERNKHRLFALTIDPRMGRFFCRLGFQHTPREELPASWAAGYDMSRPSEAYVLDLSTL